MANRIANLLRKVGLMSMRPIDLGRVWEKWEETEPVKKGGKFVCPHCHGSDFLEGPSGGMSTNVECNKCGCRWNANPMGMRWQYIGRNDDLRVVAQRIREERGIT